MWRFPFSFHALVVSCIIIGLIKIVHELASIEWLLGMSLFADIDDHCLLLKACKTVARRRDQNLWHTFTIVEEVRPGHLMFAWAPA